MDGGIGTCYEVDSDGSFTGRFDGPFVYGPGKVEAMEAFAAEHGIDLAESFAYSDSVSDLPMLRAVGHPVVVNPDPPLAELAREEGWQTMRFEQLGRRLVALAVTLLATVAGFGASRIAARRTPVDRRISASSVGWIGSRTNSALPSPASLRPPIYLVYDRRPRLSHGYGAAAEAGNRGARGRVQDDVGPADRAALRTGGPRPPIPRSRSAGRASTRSPAVPMGRCTGGGSGRCASSPASARSRRPTSASTTCSTTARPGLSTAFDMPTLMGYDSDHERSLGEVGREGVAVDSLDDMEQLFDGIPLGGVTTSMTINAPAAILLAFYVLVGEKQGVPAEKLGGTIQTDILKEYIAQKEWCFPIEPAMRLVTDMIEWCTENMPRWHPVSISGYHIREAGSTAQQELAFTLKDGFTYVERALERGLDIDDFAPRLSFFFNAHIDFFEEIAKYRAARRIWAREMRDTYGAKREESMRLRFHAQTAGVSLTAQQPLNNIVRTSLEALAAVLGGTQSLHTNSFDEALALPTEEAVRVALRTQQIIAFESGVANTPTRSAAPGSSRS